MVCFLTTGICVYNDVRFVKIFAVLYIKSAGPVTIMLVTQHYGHPAIMMFRCKLYHSEKGQFKLRCTMKQLSFMPTTTAAKGHDVTII